VSRQPDDRHCPRVKVKGPGWKEVDQRRFELCLPPDPINAPNCSAEPFAPGCPPPPLPTPNQCGPLLCPVPDEGADLGECEDDTPCALTASRTFPADHMNGRPTPLRYRWMLLYVAVDGLILCFSRVTPDDHISRAVISNPHSNAFAKSRDGFPGVHWPLPLLEFGTHVPVLPVQLSKLVKSARRTSRARLFEKPRRPPTPREDERALARKRAGLDRLRERGSRRAVWRSQRRWQQARSMVVYGKWPQSIACVEAPSPHRAALATFKHYDSLLVDKRLLSLPTWGVRGRIERPQQEPGRCFG
jgi:hypothetical protein